MEREKSELNEFIAQIKELTYKLRKKGEGKVNINLQSHPRRKGHSELKVCVPNLIPSLNFFSSGNLRNHLSQSHTSTDEEAFSILKKSLLDILDVSGFGQVQLTFEKNKREETIIFCEVTISQKHVLSSI